MTQSGLIPVERIEQAIYLIRGEKVMLDRDLATLYQVETRILNQAVRRNRERFPADFMFELTREEIEGISQIVTSSTLRFSKRVTAFTEQGVAMLSSVLHSRRSVQVNIEIMRAFVRLRQMLATNSELSRRLDELENSTIVNSRWCSTQSDNLWRLLRQYKNRSAFVQLLRSKSAKATLEYSSPVRNCLSV